MTRDEAEAIAAEVKRLMADGTGYGSAIWGGCVVAIGWDDDTADDDWYVRIDKRTGEE